MVCFRTWSKRTGSTEHRPAKTYVLGEVWWGEGWSWSSCSHEGHWDSAEWMRSGLRCRSGWVIWIAGYLSGRLNYFKTAWSNWKFVIIGGLGMSRRPLWCRQASASNCPIVSSRYFEYFRKIHEFSKYSLNMLGCAQICFNILISDEWEVNQRTWLDRWSVGQVDNLVSNALITL